jgi:hypothetical protein
MVCIRCGARVLRMHRLRWCGKAEREHGRRCKPNQAVFTASIFRGSRTGGSGISSG